MASDSFIRIAAHCVVLAGAETLHGIVHTVWVVPRIGKDLAIRLSALTGLDGRSVAERDQRSFAPLPARICGRALEIRATRVAAVLAEERWIT
jgi:hypothetical protein